MLQVECVRSAHEMDKLRGRWEWLTAQRSYTLFQGFELNRQAAAWFSSRESPHVIVAESDSGLAIIPAVRRPTELGLIGETLFDYRDVLCEGDRSVLGSAWRELAKVGLPLEVTALRSEEVRERWWGLESRPFCNAPATRIADTTSASFCHEHRKSAKAARHLAHAGLRLVRRDRELRDLAEWVYRRKAEWSGTSKNLFQDRLRQDFMIHMMHLGVGNWCAWSYETDTDEIAAALVTLDDGAWRRFYTIHHDPLWERLSPGQSLIYEVTRETLAEGMNVDFMTGEYAYKNRLATSQVPLYRVRASPEQMAVQQAAREPEAA